MKVEDCLRVVCYSVGRMMDGCDESGQTVDVVRLDGDRDKVLRLVGGRGYGGGRRGRARRRRGGGGGGGGGGWVLGKGCGGVEVFGVGKSDVGLFGTARKPGDSPLSPHLGDVDPGGCGGCVEGGEDVLVGWVRGGEGGADGFGDLFGFVGLAQCKLAQRDLFPASHSLVSDLAPDLELEQSLELAHALERLLLLFRHVLLLQATQLEPILGRQHKV